MATQDLYKGLADRFDLFQGPFGEHPPRVVGFFRALFAMHQVTSVLDCACGTGRRAIGTGSRCVV